MQIISANIAAQTVIAICAVGIVVTIATTENVIAVTCIIVET